MYPGLHTQPPNSGMQGARSLLLVTPASSKKCCQYAEPVDNIRNTMCLLCTQHLHIMRCGLSEHNLHARTNWKNQEDPVLCCESSTCENLRITLPQKAQASKISQKEQRIRLSCREPKRRKILYKRKKHRTSMYTNFW